MKYHYQTVAVPRTSDKTITESLNEMGALGYRVVDTWEYGIHRYFVMEAEVDEEIGD